MLAGLQEEITAQGLTGASNRIIVEKLNTPGTAQTAAWVVAQGEALISKNELFTYKISNETFVKLIDYMGTEAGKYIKIRLDVADQLDMASSLVRGIVSALYTEGICTEAEYNALLRIGEVEKSRAEELTEAAEGTARYLTLEDFA